MATSTLVQFLEAGEPASVMNRRQVETFLTTATIAAGDWVAFDTGKTGADKALHVIATPAVAGRGNVVGVALAAATGTASIPATVEVVVGGYVAAAKVVAGTAQHASLTTDGAAAGTAITYATGTHTGTGPCGVALTAEAGGFSEAYVYSKF